MKPWFTIMAGPSSLEDLRELFEPILPYIRGVCATYHGVREDEEAKYLESIKGEGMIVYLPYVGRHSHSRNAALWCGRIEQGDWCMSCDCLERVPVEFVRDMIPALIKDPPHHANCFMYYGKAYLFQYHESMRYHGTPHEALIRDDGGLRALELSQYWPDDSKVRVNVRPLKRDRWHWIDQYARYMMFPWGSNHALHGLQHQGDVAKLFPAREQARLEFIDEMRKRGYPRTLEGLKTMMKEPLDERLKWLINRDKVWVDYYRFHILGQRDLVDEHSWSTKQDIP